MAVEFRLPDLGEGITEGELVRWLVKPGDLVTLDQAIAQVQTDKAVVELPAPAAGAIVSLDVEEGQVVPVGTLLVTIEDGATIAHEGASERAGVAAEPAVTRPGAAAAVPAESNGWSAAPVAPQRKALAAPAVRRLARELGIDIAAVQGSGPAGRVVAEDVRTAAGSPTSPAQQIQPRTIAADTAIDVTGEQLQTAMEDERIGAPAHGMDEGGPVEERIPLRGLRRRIAENMVLSVTTIPQVTSLVEVDASALVAARRSVLPAAEARGVKLSYLPFVVKALVQALKAFPYVNAALDDDRKEIVLKRRYHIGIATATPDGLLVPVLRHADRLTLLEIAAELTRLAEAGRERKLGLDELRGSTFTISNYGTVGGFYATPIINPGEAAILGLGRIAERPWAVEGRVEVRPILPLSFTADHRLIDGELAMRFMNTLIATIENPNLLLLELR